MQRRKCGNSIYTLLLAGPATISHGKKIHFFDEFAPTKINCTCFMAVAIGYAAQKCRITHIFPHYCH